MATNETIRRGFGRLFRLTCRPQITGIENVPTEGPFILASNHLSFLDSPVLQALSPRMVHFFAKAEYFSQPGPKGAAMKWFFESVGSIPVQRGQQAASVAALEDLVALLERGEGVGIYPEGTRSRDGRLYRGRTGVGWLTLATGAPVVPVGLAGTQHLQPAGARIPTPSTFSLTFGEPLHFGHPGRKHTLPQRKHATAQVMDAIAELTGQERVDSFNAPPASAA